MQPTNGSRAQRRSQRTEELQLCRSALRGSFGNGRTAFGDDWLWREHDALTDLSMRCFADDRWIVVASAHAAFPSGTEVLAVYSEPTDSFRPLSSIHRCVQRGAVSLPFDGRPRMRWLRPNLVAFLTLPSFASPAFENEAVAFVRSLGPKAGLIIDFRSNGGGDTPERLVAALMPQRYRYWRWMTPLHDALHLGKGAPRQRGPRSPNGMNPQGMPSPDRPRS